MGRLHALYVKDAVEHWADRRTARSDAARAFHQERATSYMKIAQLMRSSR